MDQTDTTSPAKQQAVSECRRDRRGDVLAYAAIFFMFFIIVVLLFVKMDQFLHDILLVIIGAMVGINKDVYGFQFGSSQGSQNKTDQLAQAIAAIPPTPSAPTPTIPTV